MAILSIEDFLKVDPNTVATPDWTHLDVITVRNVFIPHHMIDIDDETGNGEKVETHTSQDIESLRMSIASGVDTTQFPGAVKFRGSNPEDLALWLEGKLTNTELQLKTGMKKPFKLVYGYGRHEAQVELGQTSWIYSLLSGTEDQIVDVQAAENEGYPQRLNREPDMRLHLSKKVRNGRIANTEEAITKEFKRIYSRRDASTRGRVVQAVMVECGTPQPFRTFPSPARIQQWIDNHSSKTYVIGGELDKESNTYGVSIGPGYLYRVVSQAARRYRKTGRYTYVIAHVGTPTKNQSIHEKRAKMIEELEELEKDFQACGMKDLPVYFMGFLPQIRDEEDVKKLVPVGTKGTHRAKDVA
jgi:hypothetical protein